MARRCRHRRQRRPLDSANGNRTPPPAATTALQQPNASAPSQSTLLFGPVDALVSAGLTVSLGGRLGGPVVSADRPNHVAGAPRFGWEKCWRTAMVGNTVLTRTSGPVGRPSFHVADFTLSNLRGGAVLGVVVPEFQPRDGPTTSAVETSLAWGYGTQRGRMLHDDEDFDWLGQTCATEGDVVRLELDLECGSLNVQLNGRALGAMVAKGLPAEVLWMVELRHAGDSVRIDRGE